MANVINSLKLGDGTYVFTTPYATCDTAAGTAAKVATITPGSNFSLETGARVAVKFTNANATSAPTLNVNSTGAKSIYFKNATITSSLNFWSAGQIVEFIYDGTNWNYSAAVSNTDTKDTTGSSNTSSKIFLVGATSQASSSTTYSHDTVYIGTDGCLNVRSADSDNERMIVAGTSIKKVTPVGTYEYGFPSLASGNSATIALTSDIPDVSNFITPNVLNASLGNYVDLSSDQTISGKKTFTGGVQFGTNTVFNNGGIQIPAANAFKVMGMYDVSLPSKSGTIALTSDIPSGGGSGDVTAAGNNTFTGTNTFKGGSAQFRTSSDGLNDPKTDVSVNGIKCTSGGNVGTYYMDGKITNGTNTLTLPLKSGTVALTSDITDTKNTAGSTDTSSKIFLIGATSQAANPQTYSHDTVYVDSSGRLTNIFTNTAVGLQTTIRMEPVNARLIVGSGATNADPALYTAYSSGSITYFNGTSYTLSFPAKAGTIATTSDIPIKTATLSGTTLSITLS